MPEPRVAIIIPTRRPEPHLDELAPALAAQRPRPDDILILDSSPEKVPAECFQAIAARVYSIDPETFNHGGTRRLATSLADGDVYVFLSQDAVPVGPEAIHNLVQSLYSEPDVGMAYGRQLPRSDARPFGAHARLFNYPQCSRTKRLSDANELGIKTCFASNSFAAYRACALSQVGGFPEHVIGAEDVYVAAGMLLAGWAVRYEAGACVYHSHDYTHLEEFKRYFDIGVLHGREGWILEHFGGTGREGLRFLKSQIDYLKHTGHARHVPLSLWRAALKYGGYRLGLLEGLLPRAVKRRLSMFPRYWSG